MKAAHSIILIFIFIINLFAQVDTTETGVHKHDGFYFRFAAGLGYSHWTKSTADNELNVSGTGLLISEQIGLTLTENLNLYFESALAIHAGEHYPEGKIDFDILGIGLNYYFIPSNVYVSLAVLPSYSSADEYQDESTIGFSINLSGGKEWWIGDNWGIGTALYLKYRANDTGISDVKSHFIGFILSATYN